MSPLEHLVMKTRDAAAGGMGTLSTTEALAAALALNRADWLASTGYTIPSALERIGPAWAAVIPAVAKAVAQADAALKSVAKSAFDDATLAGSADQDGAIDVSASLVTCGEAPGYRDATLTFDVRRPGATAAYRLCLRVDAKDSEQIAAHIRRIHRLAWDQGTPIDVQPGEQRPRWID